MSSDNPTKTPDNIMAMAHHDASTISKTDGPDKQAEAYHDAYTSFVTQLQNAPNQDQAIKQFKADMSSELGAARLGELELTWAGNHLDAFNSAHQTEQAYSLSGHSFEIPTQGKELSGDKLANFKSGDASAGERSFEDGLAADITQRYKSEEFSWFRHTITADDLAERAKSLGQDADTTDAARKQAYGLMSPVDPQIASSLGLTKKDGSPTTLYDVLSQPDGSGIKKYGFGSQFDELHNALLMSGKLTPEQDKTVRDLWNNWDKSPLRANGKFFAITPRSINKTTGGLPDLMLTSGPGQNSVDGTAESGKGQEPTATAPVESGRGQEPTASAPVESGRGQEPTASAPVESGRGQEPTASAPVESGRGQEPKPAAPVDSGRGLEPTASAPADSGRGEKPSAGSAPEKGTGAPAGPADPAATKGDTKDPGLTNSMNGGDLDGGKSTPGQSGGHDRQSDANKPGADRSAPPPAQLDKQSEESADNGDGPRVIRLGHGSLYDQLAVDLRAQHGGESVSSKEVREYLANIAKVNHWPGSAAQWNAYVRTGSMRHLPRTLNSHLRGGMEIIIPSQPQ